MKLNTLVKNWKIWLFSILLLCILYFPLFYRLDASVIRVFDEARNANSAIEMLENKNFLIRHYDGAPDMWDVKPPFLIWLQALSIKLFGCNELAIRLPSAFAALFTILLILIFFYKVFKSPYPGILAGLVLVTSIGYVGRHVSRTGDHDSLVILFMVSALLFYYLFLEEKDTKRRNVFFIITIIALVLGTLTKSITSLMFLPSMFLYTLISGNIKKVFSLKIFYTGTIIYILCIGSYYITREVYNPGYLKMVWFEELIPRYLNTEKEFHDLPFLYYIQNMYEERFSPWIYICAIAILFQWFIIPQNQKSFMIYISLNLLIFLLIISTGTNNVWYDAPAYPLMSIIVGQFIYSVIDKLIHLFNTKRVIHTSIAIIITISIFFFPYKEIIERVSEKNDPYYMIRYFSICYVLKDYLNEKEKAPESLGIVYEDYEGHIKFYVKTLRKEKKINNIYFIDKENIQPGETIVASESEVIDYLKMKYAIKKIGQNEMAELYYIDGFNNEK